MSLLEIKSDEIFCDLGSGIGKAVLRVALEANCKKVIGIELSPSRNKAAERAKSILQSKQLDFQLPEIEFKCQDILTTDLSDVTAVYWFSFLSLLTKGTTCAFLPNSLIRFFANSSTCHQKVESYVFGILSERLTQKTVQSPRNCLRVTPTRLLLFPTGSRDSFCSMLVDFKVHSFFVSSRLTIVHFDNSVIVSAVTLFTILRVSTFPFRLHRSKLPYLRHLPIPSLLSTLCNVCQFPLPVDRKSLYTASE